MNDNDEKDDITIRRLERSMMACQGKLVDELVEIKKSVKALVFWFITIPLVCLALGTAAWIFVNAVNRR